MGQVPSDCRGTGQTCTGDRPFKTPLLEAALGQITANNTIIGRCLLKADSNFQRCCPWWSIYQITFLASSYILKQLIISKLFFKYFKPIKLNVEYNILTFDLTRVKLCWTSTQPSTQLLYYRTVSLNQPWPSLVSTVLQLTLLTSTCTEGSAATSSNR